MDISWTGNFIYRGEKEGERIRVEWKQCGEIYDIVGENGMLFHLELLYKRYV